MKATVYTDDYTVIFEGEAAEVSQAVNDFFIDYDESFDDRLCRACKHDDAPSNGAELCLDCPGNERFELKPGGGEHKPNYAVHPADTIRDMIDTKGGVSATMAVNLGKAFDNSAIFWINLWFDYKNTLGRKDDGL